MKLTASSTAAPKSSGKITKTVSYYMAFIVLGLVAASMGPTLPGLAEHTHTNLGEISFLFIARALGTLVGAFLGGRLSDHLPGHPLVAAILLVMAAMMATTPLMSLLGLLTMVLFILGISEGALDVSINTFLVWVHSHKVGPFMNGLHFFFGVGAFLSPIIIAQAMLLSGDITWAYWILALLILPIALWLLCLPNPPVRDLTSPESSTPTNYLLVGLISLLFFVYVGAEMGFGSWIFTYAVTLNLAGTSMAAYLTSAFWALLTIGRLLTVPLAIRFRPRVMLLSSLGGCLLSSLMMSLWSHSLPIIWLGTLGIGFSMAPVFPTLLSLAERRLAITGTITSLFLAGGALGNMTIPWLIGQLFERVGPPAMMWAITLSLLLALAALAALTFYFPATPAENAPG